MSDAHKKRASDALNKFYAKQMHMQEKERTGTPRKKNERPEWELTKKPCMKWFKAEGFSMSIVESKAVYSATEGKYLHGQTDAGFSDAAGCTPDGIGAFVEFKAPGRRSNLSEGQRQFLLEKINKGCFAVVVDSVSCLESIWSQFQSTYRIMGRAQAIALLLRHLPRERRPHQQDADEDGLQF